MAESTPIETVHYDNIKCLPENKRNPVGPCIMKIQNGHTIIDIPTNRIVSKLRDLKSLSVWRSVPLSEPTEASYTELEHNLHSCKRLTKESLELLKILIGVEESDDEDGTTNIKVTEENKSILNGCKLLSDEEMKELDILLEKKGGKRKSRKSKKARKSKKNKSKKSRKTRKSKSHKK